ncbi:MAG: hypothetical protein GEU91_13990 [Rhizobiales bacterium]|nr:hypothetical protein [Hyphomicrobiales bacterium]
MKPRSHRWGLPERHYVDDEYDVEVERACCHCGTVRVSIPTKTRVLYLRESGGEWTPCAERPECEGPQ